MHAIGWTPRAAGWFTKPLVPGYTGVLATGAASRRTAPGEALVTLYVHLRREDVETVVRELVDSADKDGGYRSATTTTSIGYLMPKPAWREWLVSRETADSVAAELVAATRDYGEPYLRRLSTDPSALVDAIRASPAMIGAVGPCRVAVTLARLGRSDEASEYVQHAVASLGTRTDPAALHLHQTAERLRRWLDQLSG